LFCGVLFDLSLLSAPPPPVFPSFSLPGSECDQPLLCPVARFFFMGDFVASFFFASEIFFFPIRSFRVCYFLIVSRLSSRCLCQIGGAPFRRRAYEIFLNLFRPTYRFLRSLFLFLLIFLGEWFAGPVRYFFLI